MSVDAVLHKLDKVKRTAQGKWIARCPAHDDKGPSLSIREKEDGKILLWCFAGCSAQEVADAAGIKMTDLFPDAGPYREQRYAEAIKYGFNAFDVLRAARFELLLVAVAASNIASGVELTEADRQRLLLSYKRLENAAHAIERT